MISPLAVGGVSWVLACACISDSPAEGEREEIQREGGQLSRAACLPCPCAIGSAWYSFSHTRCLTGPPG